MPGLMCCIFLPENGREWGGKMGNVKYPWWPYVQAMIRKYPSRMRRYDELKRVELREVEAVRMAIRLTQQKEDGRERMRLVKRIYWTYGKKTMSGLAMELYISRATAFRWSSEFIMLVAECFGIYDPE
jgi:hypothetical protein